MNISELNRMLADRAEEICRKLLPNGKRQSKEWAVGSLGGEAGQSLKIHLSGSKAGVWADFSTGEAGDLVDLWREVYGLSMPDALNEIKTYLGVQDPEPFKRDYEDPAKPKCQKPQSAVLNWLLNERKLSQAAVNTYQVGESGNLVIFPFKFGDKLRMCKQRDITDKKQQRPTSSNQEPCLFGWQAISDLQRVAYITEGECFPGSAKVLTVRGWVQLEDYSGERIAQFSNGIIEFVYPIAKIKKHFTGELIRHENRGYVSLTTPGHNLVSIDQKGRYYKHTAEQGPSNWSHKIPRSGSCSGVGIPLSDDQIRLCIAVSADAAIDKRKQSYGGGAARVECCSRYARFGFKKQRKVERLCSLLDSCGLAYSNSTIKNGYQSICLGIPDWVPGRELPWEWIELATIEQRKLILDEIVLWDGNTVPNRTQTEYSTKHLSNAEWVQAVAHTSGIISTIIPRSNEHGSWYKVSILHGKSYNTWQQMKGREKRIPYDGFVYCLQVPSGMLLVSQENKVTVTGNCDAMAMFDYGFPALSVPFGGGGGAKQGNWIENEYSNLDRFEEIYLVMDSDQAGEDATKEIINRLGAERCKVVTLPRKDANQCLIEGISQEEISRAVRNAKTLDPEELRSADLYESKIVKLLHPDGTREPGFFSPWAKCRDLFYFRYAELTILNGVNGHGKSQVAGHLILAAMSQGERCCIASMEIKPERLLARMTRQAGGLTQGVPSAEYIHAISTWFREKLWIYDCVGTARVKRMMETFVYARKRYGVRVFVIDSLMKCGIAEDDYNGQKAFVEALCDFKNQYDAHVFLVTHSRKGETEEKPTGKFDVKGSSSITDLADNVFIAWRNKRKEKEMEKPPEGKDISEIEDMPDALLICPKQRNGDWEGRVSLWFDRSCYQYLPNKDSKPKEYVQYSNMNYGNAG